LVFLLPGEDVAGGEAGHPCAVDLQPAAAVGLRLQAPVVVRVKVVQRQLLGLADVEVAGDADVELLDGMAGVATERSGRGR
jgi:hypothetical protein